jgi:hypothetical protein
VIAIWGSRVTYEKKKGHRAVHPRHTLRTASICYIIYLRTGENVPIHQSVAYFSVYVETLQSTCFDDLVFFQELVRFADSFDY